MKWDTAAESCMKRRRCDSPFSFRSAVPVHVCLCTDTHVRVCIYTNQETSQWSLRCSPASRIFPRLFLSFPLCHLVQHPVLSLFVIPLPSPPRELNEKSEYATIFKWYPRDTLLNALFASPPTSPAHPLILSIVHTLSASTVGRRSFLVTDQTETSTFPGAWLKTHQRSRHCDSNALRFARWKYSNQRNTGFSIIASIKITDFWN